MCPMHLGSRLHRSALVLALVAAPALTGCALFDLGSSLDDALELVPADTYQVWFADRAAMAERLGLDDIEPRAVSDADVEDYVEATNDRENDAVATTELAQYLSVQKDGPLNEFDVEWEISASWGDPDEGSRFATVWKVGDEVDFDDLADDLEENGYDRGGSGDRPVFTIDPSAVIDSAYPHGALNVLLDEDEQIVATTASPDAIEQIGDVIADDADSLADDGGLDDLVDRAEDDPELAFVATDGPAVCGSGGERIPTDARTAYDDLGRPEARALFVSSDDAKVLLALKYDSEDAAGDDLAAREELVEEGADPRNLQPFDELGDFSLEQHDEFLVIEEDFEGGARVAVDAEQSGSGPGFCLPAG